MTKPMVKIHNADTGEIVLREMNTKELAELKLHEAEVATKLQAETAKAAEKAALLAKLGITEEEAQLLLGGN
jgi:hypothetical protein